MDLVGSVNWQKFKDLINNDATDTFFKDTIIWKKWGGVVDEFMEDGENADVSDITLECLIQYNNFKVWPMNQPAESGELDRQNMVVLFNIAYLKTVDAGIYVTAKGNLDMDQAMDRFEFNGIMYKCTGETFASQAQDEPLLLQLNLSREELNTGEYTR